jgi:hypothetical protein
MRVMGVTDTCRYTVVMEVGGQKYRFPFVYIPNKPWRLGEMGLGLDVLLEGAGAPAEKQTFPGDLKQQVGLHGARWLPIQILHLRRLSKAVKLTVSTTTDFTCAQFVFYCWILPGACCRIHELHNSEVIHGCQVFHRDTLLVVLLAVVPFPAIPPGCHLPWS